MSKKHCTEMCLKTGICDSLTCGNTLPAPTVDAQQIDSAIDKLVDAAWAKKSVTPFPRWISVEDRLPTEQGEYLVVANDIISEWRDLVTWDDVWCDENGAYPPIVTHWMPLPPSPLSEEEKP